MNSFNRSALYRFRTMLIGMFFIGFIAACTPQSMQPSERQVSQWVEQLNVIYDEYLQASLELEPLRATYLGEHKYNNLLPDTLSSEHRERVRMLEEEYLASVQRFAFEHLPEDAQLSYQIFVRDREMALMALTHPAHLMPLNQFYNIANQLAILGSGSSAQPFQTAQDYTMWAERMRAIPNLIDGVIRNMEEGIEHDIVQPRVLMERALDQIAAHLVDELTDSLFYQPITTMPEEFSEQEVLYFSQLYADLIAETVLPAYQRLHDFVRDDYIPMARVDSYGIGALPGGQEWYAYNVRWQTTTDLTADEIHAIGELEVARIQDEIRGVMNEVGFSGSLDEFFAFTRDDEQFHYASGEEMDLLPPFRKFGGETAFIEGWALYAESLGSELGVHGPYDRYGANIAELWRAIQLVVDTGIHAKGWSRQQVLDYMYANAPVAEARAVAEAERFMALPGQALAYTIGELKIRELRNYAENELGDNFDVREFHRQVLRHGSLPLSVLETQIHQWIAQQS